MNYSIEVNAGFLTTAPAEVSFGSQAGRRPSTVPTGVFEQLQQEVKFSDYLARREKERRSKRSATRRSDPSTARGGKPHRRAKATPAMLWLRDGICSLVFGEKTPDGVRPSQKIEELVGRWNLGLSLRKLSNYRLADHFSGAATCYFFGNGDPDAEYTLAMIDIDVQKSGRKGSPEGARAFAEHLRRVRFPDLYFERSTGGSGVHAYVRVRKLGESARAVNEALRRLEAWLRAEARRVNADIELVEIMGTCLEIDFHFGNMKTVKYGDFAKLPREVHRFEEWRGTTVVTLGELQGPCYDVAPEAETESGTDSPRLSSRSKADRRMQGSVSGKHISDEELQRLPAYEAMYRRMTSGKDIKARKFAVTAHDFAVALLLLRFFKKNPNPDGSLPGDRVGGMWTGLYAAGDVQRPWNHHRWKAIRDFLSRQGHIHWTDNRYEYGHTVNGKYVKGTACKFSITDAFAETLDVVGVVAADSTGGASLVDTAIPRFTLKNGNGAFLLPERFPISVEKERLFWMRAYEACECLCAA